MTLRLPTCILVFVAALSAACANEPPPGVSQVMSRTDCKQIDRGARLINYDELAKLRGTNLIEMAAPQESADALRLVVVSLGKQGTPGNRVVVREVASASASELTVTVDLDEPAWDKLRDEATANPCLVLGFDHPGFERVHVRSSDGPLDSIVFRSAAK